MQRYSKGVSPLIAAVLLIAFTMAIASISGPWFSELIGGIQDDTSDDAEDVVDASRANLEVIDTSYNDSFVDVSVRNTGSMMLENFTVSSLGSKPVQKRVNSTLRPGEIKTYTLEVENPETIIIDSENLPVRTEQKISETDIEEIDDGNGGETGAEGPEDLNSVLSEMSGQGTEESPYAITDAYELQAMYAEPAGHYRLEENVDASETENWDLDTFMPVGFVYPSAEGVDFYSSTKPTTNDAELLYQKVTMDSPNPSGQEDMQMGEIRELEGKYYTLYENRTVEINGNIQELFSGSTQALRIAENISIDSGGFAPVRGFNGSLDGQGNEITGLTIDAQLPNTGLISSNRGNLTNIRLLNADIKGSNSTGALTGNNYGLVENSYVTGAVRGNEKVGGLIGHNFVEISNVRTENIDVAGDEGVGGLVGQNNGHTENNGTVINSYSTGYVEGDEEIGGLVGDNYQGKINGSYSTGRAEGTEQVGGLAGRSSHGMIIRSYATGPINGEMYVGGLVGWSWGGEVHRSYAVGDVNGTDQIGGLVGRSSGGGLINNSYAKGEVSGNSSVGGLTGFSSNNLSNSYAVGSVSGTEEVGGLTGINFGVSDPEKIKDSYWDEESTGQSNGIGDNSAKVGNITGLTTTEMQGSTAEQKMSNLDFENIWSTAINPEDYPVLRWQE